MNNAILPFIYEDNPVRVVMDEKKEPWFVAKDVCRILEISNNRDAVANLDDDEKGVVKTDTLGGGCQEMVAVSEPGLYTLIFRSNKPAAKPFRRWITHEVLPSLRKTGKYALHPEEEEAPRESNPSRTFSDSVWLETREASQGIPLPYRVKLLSLACQINRLDQTVVPSRESVLHDFSELCRNFTPQGTVEKFEREGGIDEFLSACCVSAPLGKEKASAMYDRFVEWYRESSGMDAPTATWFGRRMSLRFAKRKITGNVYYFGLRLIGKQELEIGN